MSRLVSERLRRKCHGYRSYFGTPPIVDQRRVVVTGLGLVTPLGPNVDSTWQRLVQGDCAIAVRISYPCILVVHQLFNDSIILSMLPCIDDSAM